MKLEDIFDPLNIQEAVDYLSSKKDTAGLDGMYLSEIADYIMLNPNWCKDEAQNFYYQCSEVRCYSKLAKSKKMRQIYQFNALDRLVARSVSQVLEGVLDGYLSDNCFSYRDNKGLLEAVMTMKQFIEEGFTVMLEFDVLEYFESISHQLLLDMLNEVIDDKRVVTLIKSFLKAKIVGERSPYVKRKGVITGCNISPILSNYYLHRFDAYIDTLFVKYVRYGDDYFLFFREKAEAEKVYELLQSRLQVMHQLNVNEKKSGIFSPFRKRILGYYFIKTKKGIIVDKPPRNVSVYDTWQKKTVEVIDHRYDVISDGILTQQHWNLLFDGENGKAHFPSEVTDYLNVYSSVVIDSRVIQLLAQKNIRVNVMDTFGDKVAVILPANPRMNMSIVQKQLQAHYELETRLLIAKEMERAHFHNLRSVLRYYHKRKKRLVLGETIGVIGEAIRTLEEVNSIDHLMLKEARVKQVYFACFNEIILDEKFAFHKRNKRPPKDAINALMSFGNVFLYNYIASVIYRSPLDIRFSFVHSVSRRSENLNLDIADIFKPVIVDRTIFAVVNRQEIQADKHFEQIQTQQGEGIYLNYEGKIIFLRALKEKLRTVVTVNGKKMRYSDLIREEVYKIYRFLKHGEAYKGYRYI